MDNIVFVLVNPQMGENIGAAARAMANFGVRKLRLVAPRDGWPNERATSMSAGAFEYMETVEVFDSTAQAVQDCHRIYATTARPRDMVKPVLTPRASAEEASGQARDHLSAVLFGAERTGLENEDITRAHAIITAPTNPDFSSLNLGQGALMVAYELFQAHQKQQAPRAMPDNYVPAPAQEFDNFFMRLQGALEDSGFFRTQEIKPRMIRNLRNTLTRAEMTSQEINTLHGVLRSLTSPHRLK